MNNKEALRDWRKDRKIVGVPSVDLYVASVIEELLEIFYNDKSKIKHMQETIMSYCFDGKKPIEENIIDAIQDIRVFSINQTELMGYDADNTLGETIKEISSRKQSPAQAEVWEKWGNDGKKWEKNKKQDKDTLYTANYEKCKR